MIITSSRKNYEVKFYPDFAFAAQLCQEEHAFFAVDRVVYELYYDRVFRFIDRSRVMLIDAVESAKKTETALELCEAIMQFPAKRNMHLLSFGGGIIQDITGFAASILYRGIDWTFVPTTLLAACDSCIGGKTSLNYKNFKNLFGTFYPPDRILICPQFFHTLSERDFESGLGEVLKFNLMSQKAGLSRMERDLPKLLAREGDTVIAYIENSLLFKKEYIEKDEFDRGVRIHLNYAHTFGHAYECMSHYEIPHGTAVAMGMVTANRISFRRNWLEQEDVERMEALLFQIIHIDLHRFDFDLEQILQAVKRDKKQTGDTITAVLMQHEMKLQVVRDVTAEEITYACGFLFERLKYVC